MPLFRSSLGGLRAETSLFSGQVAVAGKGVSEVPHRWRILYYTEDGLCEVLEVVRKRRPTRLARAFLCEDYTHFDIQQMI